MGHYDNQKFTEHLAKAGNFLVISFTKSKSELPDVGGSTPVRVKTREHWVFKVEASKKLRYRPYNAGQAIAGYNDSQGNDPDPYLEPRSGTGPVPLVDRSGQEILRNDDDAWFVYHIGVSPLQGDIRVYPQIPDSQPGGVFQYLGSNRPAGVSGDPVGYISGDDHPSYYDPEKGLATSLVWDTGVNTDIRYQFFNEHKTRDITPLLNISGAGYVLSPVTDNNIQENIIEAANTGAESVTHVDWGPIRETFTYELPDEWQSSGNYIEELEPSIPDMYGDSVSDEVRTNRELQDLSQDDLEEIVRGAINDG
jgi:hypothetical protein